MCDSQFAWSLLFIIFIIIYSSLTYFKPQSILTSVILISMEVKITVYTGKYPEALFI